MSDVDDIVLRIVDFIDDDDDESIQEALTLIDTARPDTAALLDRLEQLGGDHARKRQAIARVRQHLGLPLIPGPVCRDSP